MPQNLMPTAIALGLCYAAYKFAPNAMAKSAAVSIGAVVLAKQVPYLRDALA